MVKDPKAEATWNRAAIAYGYFRKYIDSKPDRYGLSEVDLVFVKNFKGGNSIICELPQTLDSRLAHYERELRSAAEAAEFQGNLGAIDNDLYERARERMVRFVSLPSHNETRITGFGTSFSSALLHFYFPKVVPILDRRVLNGSGIPGLEVDEQGQVKNMLQLYPPLIDYFRDRLRRNSLLDIRSLDKELFCATLDPIRFPGRRSTTRPRQTN